MPQRIGITGPPGVGKSTLICRLLAHYKEKGRFPSALLVDPSSPKTGGAILGDRIRMQDLCLEPEIFIRSFATRGAKDGIPKALPPSVVLLQDLGRVPVFIETVGAGQLDVAVRRLSDAVLLVTSPHLGDEIQAMKAGIAEVADIVVVNKCDHPRAQQTVRHWQASVPIPVIGVSCQGAPGFRELTDWLDGRGFGRLVP